MAGISVEETSSATNCAACPLRDDSYARYQGGSPIYGEGDWSTGILLVGMCPGEVELRTGWPFSGPAGEVLDEAFSLAGIPRKSVRIENILCCRPTVQARTHRGQPILKDRDPTAVEMKACSPRLLALIAVSRPRVIVPLGAVATRFIEARAIPKISTRRGWVRPSRRFGYNCTILPTFHPAVVKHTGDSRYTAMIAEDLRAAAELSRHGIAVVHDWGARRINSPKEFDSFVTELIAGGRPFGLDVEHSGQNIDFEVYTIGIAASRDERAYLSLWETGPHGPKRIWEGAALGSILESFKRLVSSGLGIATHGGSTESHAVLKLTGIELNKKWLDTQGAHHVCEDEDWDTQSLHHLHLQFPDLRGYKDMLCEHLKKDTLDGADFGRVTTDVLGRYCAMDADTTMRLADKYGKLLRKDERLRNVFWNAGMPALRMFSAIERNGVLLDLEACEEAREKWQSDADAVLAETRGMTWHDFKPRSYAQVCKLLYQQKGLPVLGHTDTGGPSTDKDTLEHLYSETQDEVLKHILRYRSLASVLSTFLVKFPKLVDRNGRLHCRYQVFGPTSGRVSSSDPNLQNVPTPPEVRRIFVARAGWKLVTIDYSQHELRVLAAISGDQEMIRIFQDGSLNFHQETADALGKSYDEAKTFNFALLYGSSARSLATRIGISPRNAEAMLERWFNRFPQVRVFLEQTKVEARANGYVRCVYGRYRHLPWINCGHPGREAEAERQAGNTVIQGPAGIYAMRNQALLYDFIVSTGLRSIPVLQVHDEIVFECPDEEIELIDEKTEGILTQPFPPLDIAAKIETCVNQSWQKP